jgi:hypothetical protein
MSNGGGMSQVFSGAVNLPGETGDGLNASLEMDDETIRLIAGGDELGSWERATCNVVPSGRGSFQMDLAGELVSFAPESPSAFAEAMTIPLTPEPQTEAEEQTPKYDYDAAIDEVIESVKPLAEAGDDDLLTKPVLVGIIGLSTMVIASVATVSAML